MEELQKNKEKSRGIGFQKTAAVVLALTIAAGSCGIAFAAAQAQENAAVSTADVYTETLTPRQVYEQNYQAVIAVSGTVVSTVYGQVQRGTVSGSGFIITSDGYAVTNYHVVEDASDLTVKTADGDEYSASVVGYDSANDVAVLKIDAENLPTVTLGSSDDLYIGDMVVAIGNPLGALTPTLTVGYVSGKDREVTTDNTTINMIQTDAAINSGSSGGPLFNMYGEVVGITSAKYSGTSSSGASIESVNFAIPINDVMNIITDLRDYGYVTGAYLGVTVQDSDSDAASYYGLPTGAYVVTVVDGYAAAEAGVQPKDTIIGIGDYEVGSVTELTRALRHFNAGDETTLTVIRNGQQLVLDITLSEKPQDLSSGSSSDTETNEQQPSSGDYEEWYRYFFGNQNGK